MSYGPKVSISNTRSLDSRYDVYGEIASGGMASVQYGRLFGPRGFSRAVAIKRLHPHLSQDPEFTSMFIDEARLSARLMHANIVHTLDVIEAPGEVALVMEYVHGESLWMLERVCRALAVQVPLRIGCAIMVSVLHGLHAAHETLDDAGQPLLVVHRDVSPQNILIGVDGVPRILDFGIAKAAGRVRDTKSGEIKGKLGYISTEQLQGEEACRRTDVYGAAVVLWEVLTGTLLFDGPNEQAVVKRVLSDQVAPPSQLRPEVPATLDAIVLRGLSRDRAARYATAQEMAVAIERAVGLATQSEVATWLRQVAGDRLDDRMRYLTALQEGSGTRSPRATAAHTTRRIATGGNTPVVDSGVVPTAASAEAPDVRPMPSVSGQAAVAAQRAVPAWFVLGRRVAVIAGASLLLGLPSAWLLLSPRFEPPTSAAFGLLHRESVLGAVVERQVEPEPAASIAKPAAADSVTVPIPQEPSTAVAAPELPSTPDVQTSELSPALDASPRKSSDTARARDKRKIDNKASKAKQSAKTASQSDRARATQRRKVAAPAQDPCVPFYEVDEHGIRRPKPECL
jgi:serine/threonine protein kinase